MKPFLRFDRTGIFNLGAAVGFEPRYCTDDSGTYSQLRFAIVLGFWGVIFGLNFRRKGGAS